MLFSIPRYANGAPLEDGFQRLFDALNVALALPVLVYSAADFFKGAWQALRHRTVSLDVPIVIGSAGAGRAESVRHRHRTRRGYLDSFAGLVFFLLIGRLFQQQAFDWIGFDRTFRSFFPLVGARRAVGRSRSGARGDRPTCARATASSCGPKRSCRSTRAWSTGGPNRLRLPHRRTGTGRGAAGRAGACRRHASRGRARASMCCAR